jgi:predicted membrane metal-binding protein
VVKEGVLQEKKWGDVQQRLDLGTELLQTGSETVTVHSGLRVSLYGHEAKTEENNESEESSARSIHWFRYGERLRFHAKIYPPRNFRNPGAFDYAGYLADNGIVAIGSTKLDSVEFLPGFAGSRAELWRTRLRRGLIERIHILWKPDESALLDAMLIGENSFLGRDILTDFQRTGTYHVLVISGLKVAVLALVTFWLLRRMQVSDLVASAITVLLTVAYALLTDVGAPVWRATLMLALYLRCAVALSPKINSEHYRRGGAGVADCRSLGAAGSEFPAQLSLRLDHCWYQCAFSGANDAACVSSFAELGFHRL